VCRYELLLRDCHAGYIRRRGNPSFGVRVSPFGSEKYLQNYVFDARYFLEDKGFLMYNILVKVC